MPEVQPLGWIRFGKSQVLVDIKARLRAGKRKILDPDRLVVALVSPPDGGRANAELVSFPSELADVPKSYIDIVQGLKSKRKVLRITTTDPRALAASLAQSVARLGR